MYTLYKLDRVSTPLLLFDVLDILGACFNKAAFHSAIAICILINRQLWDFSRDSFIILWYYGGIDRGGSVEISFLFRFDGNERFSCLLLHPLSLLLDSILFFLSFFCDLISKCNMRWIFISIKFASIYLSYDNIFCDISLLLTLDVISLFLSLIYILSIFYGTLLFVL